MREIPITVDGVYRDANSPLQLDDLSRCVFFSFVSDDPSPGWLLEVGTQFIPFFMLGIHGILYQPHLGKPEFQSLNDLDDLINTLEGLPGDIAVETGIIWVPTKWLDQAYQDSPKLQENRLLPQRGDVFRIEYKLFTDLWRVSDGRAILKDIEIANEKVSKPSPPLLRFSPRETRVFAEWTEAQFKKVQGSQGFSQQP